MRGAVAAVALCLLILGANAVAQPVPNGPAWLILTDPQGDASEVGYATGGAADPGDDSHDLLAAWIGGETDTHIRAGLKLGDAHEPEPSPAANGQRLLSLCIGPRDGSGDNCGSGPFASGTQSCYGFWFYYRATCVDFTYDYTNDTVWVSLPRWQFAGSDGRPVRAGTDIGSDFSVGVVQLDPMHRPDQVWSLEPFNLTGGDRHIGDIRMWSPKAFRASNGEEATFVYPLLLENNGTVTKVAALSALTSVPGLIVRLPEAVRLEPGQRIEVPVVVGTTMRHMHGSTATVQIDAATSSGDLATAFVGIDWLAVPQPAGHHSTLFFHSAPSTWSTFGTRGTAIWANTLEVDGRGQATDEPVTPTAYDQLASTNPTLGWAFQLNPSLLLGLDFDLARQGLASLTFEFPLDWESLEVSFRLYYCDPQGRGVTFANACGGENSALLLAEGTATTAGGSSGPAAFDVPLTPTAAAERIDYDLESNLVAYVEAKLEGTVYTLASGTDTQPLFITDEGSIELPLLEYVDSIPPAPEASFQLQVDGEATRFGNPGRTVVFSLQSSERESNVELIETKSGWGKVSRLENGLTALAVSIPENATVGDAYQAVVTATNPAGMVAAARLLVHVADPAVRDVPDAAPQDDTTKGSPAPPVSLLLLGALVGVALRRRR